MLIADLSPALELDFMLYCCYQHFLKLFTLSHPELHVFDLLGPLHRIRIWATIVIQNHEINNTFV